MFGINRKAAFEELVTRRQEYWRLKELGLLPDPNREQNRWVYEPLIPYWWSLLVPITICFILVGEAPYMWGWLLFYALGWVGHACSTLIKYTGLEWPRNPETEVYVPSDHWLAGCWISAQKAYFACNVVLTIALALDTWMILHDRAVGAIIPWFR